MNDEQKNDDKVKLPIWAMVGSAVWVVLWTCFLICNHPAEDVGLSDLGAYLSGVFAPLAWFWFVLSYYAQKQELAMQRRELKLQREAIEQSVKAQEGSENALKQQSQALLSQLEITQEQYLEFKKNLDGKKPKFHLIAMEYNIGDEIPKFFLFFKNLGGRCEVTHIKTPFKRFDHLIIDKVFTLVSKNLASLSSHLQNQDLNNFFCISVQYRKSLPKDINSIQLAFSGVNSKIESEFRNHLLGEIIGYKFSITYFVGDSSDSDEYEFYKLDNRPLDIKRVNQQ